MFTNPTIFPESIEDKEASEVPSFSIVLEDDYRPAYHTSFEGNVDWLHFKSQANPSNVDRKTGVEALNQISYNRFGTSELYTTNFWFSTSWTNGDGTPLADMNSISLQV